MRWESRRESFQPVCPGSDVKRGSSWGTVRPSNQQECFPATWEDPLELYGAFRTELMTSGFDSAVERTHVRRLLGLRGPRWVWLNRHRLVSLHKFIFRRGTKAKPTPDRRCSG
jgi:hypothetical protein